MNLNDRSQGFYIQIISADEALRRHRFIVSIKQCYEYETC